MREGKQMADIYGFIRKMTGLDLVSPEDARALTDAVDGLIDEINEAAAALRARDDRIAELEEECRLSMAVIADERARAEAAEARVERLRGALEPLARLEVPAKPQGNAGAYSIFHDDIRTARSIYKETSNASD